MLATKSILSREACSAQPVTHPRGENGRVCSNRGSGKLFLSTTHRHRSPLAPRASPLSIRGPIPYTFRSSTIWHSRTGYDPWHLCLRSRRQSRCLDVAHNQTLLPQSIATVEMGNSPLQKPNQENSMHGKEHHSTILSVPKLFANRSLALAFLRNCWREVVPNARD